MRTPSEPWIFLSYRRSDASSWAARQIAAGLESHCGPQTVFCDTRSITPGTAWEHAIAQSLESCKALVALIDSAWLPQKLSDPEDWVRREIEFALSNRFLILPIILNGGATPTAAELPSSLASFAAIQSFFVDGRSDSILEASLAVVARRILESIRARIVFTRQPQWWWKTVDCNNWRLFFDGECLLSLSEKLTSARIDVSTGPHTVRVEWSEYAFNPYYQPRSFRYDHICNGKTESQAIVLRPGEYSFSLKPGPDTRGVLKRIRDFLTPWDSKPRELDLRFTAPEKPGPLESHLAEGPS